MLLPLHLLARSGLLALALLLAPRGASADLVPTGYKIVPHALRVEGTEKLASHWFVVFDCYQPDALDYCVITAPGDYNAGLRAGLFALPREIVKTKPAMRMNPDAGPEDAGVAIIAPFFGALGGESFFRKGHPRMAGPLTLAEYPEYLPLRHRVKRFTDVLVVEGVSGKKIEARYTHVVYSCLDGKEHQSPWDGQGERPAQPCGEDPRFIPPPPPPPSASAAPPPPSPPSDPGGESRWLWGLAVVMLALGVASLAFGVKKR